VSLSVLSLNNQLSNPVESWHILPDALRDCAPRIEKAPQYEGLSEVNFEKIETKRPLLATVLRQIPILNAGGVHRGRRRGLSGASDRVLATLPHYIEVVTQ
jgi:hypothetical protein